MEKIAKLKQKLADFPQNFNIHFIQFLHELAKIPDGDDVESEQQFEIIKKACEYWKHKMADVGENGLKDFDEAYKNMYSECEEFHDRILGKDESLLSMKPKNILHLITGFDIDAQFLYDQIYDGYDAETDEYNEEEDGKIHFWKSIINMYREALSISMSDTPYVKEIIDILLFSKNSIFQSKDKLNKDNIVENLKEQFLNNKPLQRLMKKIQKSSHDDLIPIYKRVQKIMEVLSVSSKMNDKNKGKRKPDMLTIPEFRQKVLREAELKYDKEETEIFVLAAIRQESPQMLREMKISDEQIGKLQKAYKKYKLEYESDTKVGEDNIFTQLSDTMKTMGTAFEGGNEEELEKALETAMKRMGMNTKEEAEKVQKIFETVEKEEEEERQLELKSKQ